MDACLGNSKQNVLGGILKLILIIRVAQLVKETSVAEIIVKIVINYCVERFKPKRFFFYRFLSITGSSSLHVS